MKALPLNAHNLLTHWQGGPFSIAVAAGAIGLALLYLRGDWRLALRARRWPARRSAAFLAGLVAADIALQSPVATFTGSYFQFHVLQHLLLMVVAPPLLALGAPSTLLLQAADRKWQTRWLAVLRSRPFAMLTHPVIVWVMYFGLMFGFFLTSLINYAMEHMALMDGLNLVFLLGACFYWWPMVGLDPIVHWKMGYGARIANLAIAVPFESFLGIAIMSERSPIASMYTLPSTHSGGALLWAASEVATFVGLVPVFFQWARAEDRAAARADARADLRASGLAVAVAQNPAAIPGPADELPDQDQLDAALARLSSARAAPATAPMSAAGAAGARAPSPTSARPSAGSAMANRFKPLFQPGNGAWEAMWKAKAGHLPAVASQTNSPPGTPGTRAPEGSAASEISPTSG